MKKALIVARWEFLTTITRRMYIFTVVAMPVFYGLLLGVVGFSARSVVRETGGLPVAVRSLAGCRSSRSPAR